ncbi:MAG: aldehyde dehydrogenase family protein [Salinisphaera sp.]|nr:aldehyde dehydrogenase family protein [Salinisphaera sp.]
MQRFQLLIDGQLVPGDAEMTVINPATGQPLTQCPRASADQLEAAVAAAKRAFPAWAATPVAERGAALKKLADAIKENGEALGTLLTQEQGKPLKEAGGEVGAAIAFLRHFANLEMPAKVIEDTDRRRVEQRHTPLGVAALIVPWNFPLLVVCGKLGPALLTGNTVVIKPAPTTPLATLFLGELCASIFPPGVVNIVTDQNDLAPLLTTHPDVRKVSFTGSTATGRKVMASSAETIKRITLELGGNDAAIMLDDADVKATARRVFGRAFANNGQVCFAIKRFYVPEAMYDEVVGELVNLASDAVVGDGMDENTRYGPLQNRMQFDKVRGLIDDTRATGGTIAAGGEVTENGGYFIRPTIVRDVTNGSRIVDEEQFGPVLPVIKYRDVDEAVTLANATGYGLGGSVWGADTERAAEVAGRIDAGTVWVNTHQEIAPNIPLAGAKQSGLGVEYAEEGLVEFTQSRIVSITKPAA